MAVRDSDRGATPLHSLGGHLRIIGPSAAGQVIRPVQKSPVTAVGESWLPTVYSKANLTVPNCQRGDGVEGWLGRLDTSASATRRCRHSRGIFPSVRQYFLEIAQEARAGSGALDEDAAPIQWVRLSTHQIELGETIERTSDRWLRHVEFGSQPANRLRFSLQVAGQEHAQLTRRQVGTIAANQRDDGLAQHVNPLFDQFRGHLDVSPCPLRSCDGIFSLTNHIFGRVWRRSLARRLTPRKQG